MKTKLYIYFLLIFSLVSFVEGQVKKEDILFTIDGISVTANEFIKVYSKNIDLVQDESQKDIDQYLELFVNFKLKLAEAKTLGFDKNEKYLREFESYKKQLAKNYLTNHKVTDELVKEAYDHISHDVKVNHILIKVDPAVTDTLSIYNQMLAYKELFINEPDFSKIQKQLHNGNTVFAEDLGYFSGFKMIYEFEKIAFNTEVGMVSEPFRTQFGYHILKVYEKRKSKGDITVGHIMVNLSQNDSTINPQGRVQEIYEMIEQGQEFEELAKQFSDDKSSAKNGGKLSSFKSGQLTSLIFENEAFNLKEIGEISKPFKSDYGWHIIKLYEKKPIESFEVLRSGLEARVKRDPRSSMINTAFINELRNGYKVPNENSALSYFESIIDERYIKNEWIIPADLAKEKSLVKIGASTLTYLDFANYLQSSQKGVNNSLSVKDIVEKQYNDFINKELLKYHESNLENINPEYAAVLAEYRDGLLLFDLMESKIWNAAKSDSVGLKNYYEDHKSKYVKETAIDVVIATSIKEENANKVKELFEANKDITTIENELNQKVIFTSGFMMLDDPRLPQDLEVKKGVSKVYYGNKSYHNLLVKDILPARQKSFEEAKGAVISDYQNQVEKDWIEELTNKYKVEINTNVLKKIQNQLNN